MARCSNSLCSGREATLFCGGCQDAIPPTGYCSTECQQNDWQVHERICGKRAYVFHVELMYSSGPKITRIVTAPEWFTFQQLHMAIQYTFGWQNCHIHTFQFRKKRKHFLEIGMRENMFGGFGHAQDERQVKLSDVYDATGSLRPHASQDGDIVPLIYQYDFGDCWDHKITFRGSKLAREARPVIDKATGCPPLEDAGGICGWDAIKEAFSSNEPTSEHEERIEWAKSVSILGDDFNPFAEVDIAQMNLEENWKQYLGDFF
ncbi:hypothetical protein K439DRAFT_1631213 [Ramaria rubella]|nr:hypothetical protein K439DRAFT_1631213 [Ramaria rubella]